MNANESWSESRCAHYELAIDIHASAERVWRAITDQIGAWWLPSFHILGANSVVTLEAWAGGRLYEQSDDRELLWYTVIAVSPNVSLDLAGYCSAEFGGPATTMLHLHLDRVSDKLTRLKVSDSLFGRVSEGLVRSLHAGWNELFVDGLKHHIENSTN